MSRIQDRWSEICIGLKARNIVLSDYHIIEAIMYESHQYCDCNRLATKKEIWEIALEIAEILDYKRKYYDT